MILLWWTLTALACWVWLDLFSEKIQDGAVKGGGIHIHKKFLELPWSYVFWVSQPNDGN